MSKITFQSGTDENPLFTVTIQVIFNNHGDMPDLQELIAQYFVKHGGLSWSVTKE